MTNATVILMVNAFGAMMKVFLVSVIGVLSAKYPKGNPLLPMTAIRHISRFSNIVLIPCLTLSNIGASISFSLFKKVGLLVPIAIGSNLLAMGLGRIFKFVHEDDPKLFLASLLTISSPNSISMPILVMQSLCEQPLVNEDFDNDSSVCFSQSTALLFIYVIGFHILYWGYVFPTFEQLQEDYENGELGLNPKPNEIKNSSLSFRMTKVIALLKHIILSPTMLGVIAGLFFGLIPFTRNLLFSETGYLYPVGGAITTLGSPVVALNCLIMSASLAHIDVDFKKLFLDYWNSVSDNLSPQRRHSIQLSSHEEIDEHKGTAFNPLQQVNLDTQCDDQREGNSEVELKNLEKALTEVIKDDGVEQASVDTSSTSLLNENLNNLPHLRSVVYLIICRLILPPLAILFLVRLAVFYHLISKDERLFQFVIVIVSASPSAQVIIVSLNQLGFQKLAGQMAYMYVFQYLACILSITFVATTALRIIYS